MGCQSLLTKSCWRFLARATRTWFLPWGLSLAPLSLASASHKPQEIPAQGKEFSNGHRSWIFLNFEFFHLLCIVSPVRALLGWQAQMSLLAAFVVSASVVVLIPGHSDLLLFRPNLSYCEASAKADCEAWSWRWRGQSHGRKRAEWADLALDPSSNSLYLPSVLIMFFVFCFLWRFDILKNLSVWEDNCSCFCFLTKTRCSSCGPAWWARPLVSSRIVCNIKLFFQQHWPLSVITQSPL